MSLLCIALHDVSTSRDARTFRRTAGSKRGDQTSLRKLKWSERKGQGQTNIALFLSPSSEEFPGAWGSLGSISPSFSSHCNLKKKKNVNNPGMSHLFTSHLIIYPKWTAFPFTNPVWQVGLGNVEVIFQVQTLNWVCSQLLAIQFLFFHW